MTYTEDIQKALADKKQVIGLRVTIKQIKQNGLKKIFLASNCGAAAEDDIRYYAQYNGVPVEKLKIDNEELSIICKKPFLVNIFAIKQ